MVGNQEARFSLDTLGKPEARFSHDALGKPEGRFSHDMGHIMLLGLTSCL